MVGHVFRIEIMFRFRILEYGAKESCNYNVLKYAFVYLILLLIHFKLRRPCI